ncbi:MAG: hypothetical protein V1705_01235 [bacterium]
MPVMQNKLRLFISELREKGLPYALKRVVNLILRPINDLVESRVSLIELRYGILPKILPDFSSGPDKFYQSNLVKSAREFWLQNKPGSFDLDGQKITRKEIFIYGGPDSKIICPVCQKSEWLSRIRQKNLFSPHFCKRSKLGEVLCSRQGDEMWTHCHQNFDFSFGCDAKLPAAKCLYLIHKGKENFLNPRCEPWLLVMRRRLAFACQVDVADSARGINWSDYDFVFTINGGNNPKFSRPNIPIIMYGHDFWPLSNKGFQWVIDWMKPDIFMASDISQWKKNFSFPVRTRFVFYPLFESSFFSRPNLAGKRLDLLLVGAKASLVYKARAELLKQIEQFAKGLGRRYKIEISTANGSNNVLREGSLIKKDAESGQTIRLLNKWSEYLGSARYAIFGGTLYPSLTYKHYEFLGSGAIPIFPETPDLKFLNIRPFEHYIPLSAVLGDNEKLSHFLDNYDKYKYIARNGVRWYKEYSDKMIFNDFEDLVGEITDNKFPKRLI